MHKIGFLVALSLVGCKDKKETPAAQPDPGPAATKPAEPAAPAQPPPPPAPAPAKLVETDLSPFGPQFKGYVAMAPEGAKLEFSDPSRFIHLDDKDFVSIGEAPYWEDAVGGLSKDPDNKNIKKVSDTEYQYERTPPLGTAYSVDVLVKIGKTKWSCNAGDPGTFTSDARRQEIAAICKSIHKK
jgi:hypothetical protein